jgi:hypothetical protein
VVYENSVRSTEEADGVAFYNPKGTKIVVGNFHIKGKVIAAMFYPCAVLIVAVTILGILMVYVVPQFRKTREKVF